MKKNILWNLVRLQIHKIKVLFIEKKKIGPCI